MSSPDNKYSFEKKELLKILFTILALTLVSLVYYFYIRQDALKSAEKRAELTMQGAERTIHIRMGKIETTVKAMRPMAEYALDNPDAMYEIARHTVEASSRIMGAGIAFKADYYPEKGHWFETYVGYHKGGDTLVTEQLGSPEHDYLQMEWFKQGLASEEGFWTNPYYDNAGGKDYLISYCLPIRDSDSEAVGLIIADITLDTLTSIVRSVKMYPHSYCSLVSGNGTVLVAPQATPKGKHHVFTEEVDGKNMTLILTIPDAEMYSRLRKSTLFFFLLALTGIFSVLFIAYHSMQNLWELNEVRAKEQRIEDELAIARSIQQSLLPSTSTANSGNKLDISGLQVPARFVGGDLYDYYIRDNKLLFCIGDVSGKGVPAAMLMTVAHSLFRTLSAHNDNLTDIMRALNEAISENNPDIMFITMFLGIMDLDTGKIAYCNAGHNPPIVVRKGGAEFIATEPCLLFGVDMSADYTSYELALAPGESLFLYTDGLTEAENVDKELFGERRTMDIAAGFGPLSAEEQIGKIRQSVRIFTEGADQSDDLTLLAIKYMPDKQSLTLTNKLDELTRLQPFADSVFSSYQIAPSVASQLYLALEEAVVNVIMYAYPEGESGNFDITLGRSGDLLTMEICDHGVPFNPLEHQESNLDVPLEERPIGGLGIHLVKEIMDSVSYERSDGYNLLRLEKRVFS